MGLVDSALINYIPAESEELTLDHFLQAHLLREDKKEDALYMIYASYVNEICLPNPEYWLANVDCLTIPLEIEEQRAHRLVHAQVDSMQVPRRRTRSQTQAAIEATQAAHMHHETHIPVPPMVPMRALGWAMIPASIKQEDPTGMNNQCSTHRLITHGDQQESPRSTHRRLGLHPNHHLEVLSTTPLTEMMT